MLITSTVAVAQESANASGGDATGSGGSVAYSIGQVVYSNQTGTSGNENQGVQQPYEIYTADLDELDYLDLSVYPNPTVDQVVIELKQQTGDRLNYQLIDHNGKIISNISSKEQSVKLDMSSYPSGNYLLNIIDPSEKVKSFKIIKN